MANRVQLTFIFTHGGGGEEAILALTRLPMFVPIWHLSYCVTVPDFDQGNDVGKKEQCKMRDRNGCCVISDCDQVRRRRKPRMDPPL
jgi:hypothetical protein